MLEVELPAKRNAESRYVLDVVLGEMLGLEFRVTAIGQNFYRFSMPGSDAELIIDSDFLISPDSGWLCPESMPREPLRDWCPADDGLTVPAVNMTLPVLFGLPGLERDGNRWHLRLDAIGGIFFMLSRYEELMGETRDRHDRFPAVASLAYREQFLERPIVDEYTELLWCCLHALWPELTRKRSDYDSGIDLSCDVDQPFDCSVSSLVSLARSCAGDILKHVNPLNAMRRVNRFVFNRLGNYRYDPFYTFDWYLDQCEQAGRKVMFHFIADSSRPMNGCYVLEEERIGRLLKCIDQRGHGIGLHASYQSFRSVEMLRAEKFRLEQVLAAAGIATDVKINRQHYLRWDAAVTADFLEQAGFTYDSTGGYADRAGFRYGTGHEFPMWSWTKGKPLELRQKPLIVMDSTIVKSTYMGLGCGHEAHVYVEMLKERARQFGGRFGLLWHNSTLRNAAEKQFFAEAIG